jgi:alpha-beta hydrolase superfamily lysophospholipase
MQHHEGTFEGVGHLTLYRQQWVPDEQAHAALVIVHGIGEHSSRYMHVVNYLVPRHYAIYAFDHRGHGRSEGQRGFIHDWSEFREDLHTFLALVRHDIGEHPLFMLCHSMGGVIGLDYCLHYPQDIRGVIASAPAIGDVAVHPILWFVARILDRIWPNFSMSPQTGSDWQISRDPVVVEATKNDPLMHAKATPRLGVQLKNTVDWIHAHASEWSLPLLVIHGTGDTLVSPDGSRRFVHDITFANVELREYEDGYHELLNDIIRDQVLADVEHWLGRHL